MLLSLPKVNSLFVEEPRQNLSMQGAFCHLTTSSHFCEFIYFSLFIWLHWVFVAALRLSLVVASRGYSSLQGSGFSLPWLLLLWSTASRCTGLISCYTWAQQLQRAALRAPRVSSCSVQLSGHAGSAVAACGSQGTQGQQLQPAALRARGVSSCGNRLVAPWHVKCSWTQD